MPHCIARFRASTSRSAGRRVLVAIALAASGASLAPAAHASAPITKLLGAPIDKDTPCYPNLDRSRINAEAGTFTDFCAAYYVRSGAPEDDDPKRVVFDTPQGFLATSDVSPQCTLAQYAQASTSASRCPANTQIGDGRAYIRVSIGGFPIAQSAPVLVYNLEHTDDELGKVGLELAPEIGGIPLPHTKLIARITLRPAPDAGLRTVLDGLPQFADMSALGLGKLPIATDGFAMRFFGTKADHPNLARDFGFLGSDCSKPQVTRATSTTWQGEVSSQTYTYDLKGCDALGFGLDGDVTTTERRPDVPTETTVSLRPLESKTGRFNSNIARSYVTLPPGMALTGQIASGPDGFPLCTPQQYGWTSERPSTCPETSQVGSVVFTSPLIKKPFVGKVFLGSQPSEGALPEVYIEAGTGSLPDSPRVKVLGRMTFDEQGRILTTLEDLPQMTFSEFRLTFRGGDHGILSMPRSCGTFAGVARTVPIAGGADAVAPLPLTVDQDCIDPAVFTPSVAVSSTNLQAGGSGTTQITITRPDRQARIAHIEADLPPGVLANLNGVGTCSPAELQAFACQAASRIGGVEAAAGLGPKPIVTGGDVFLMDPPAGAAAGVGIIVAVKFGDVDLGKLALTARIDLRQSDFGLRFSADVPQKYRGFPLDLQRLVVSLDRPGFGLNATSCDPLAASSTLRSDLGGSASAPVSIQFRGCAALPFSPKLTTQVTGSTAAGARPGINVQLAQPPGAAAIKKATVTLPLGLGADVQVAKRACKLAQFESQTCPDTAVVGSARASVAVAPEPLTGPVYLVTVPERTLPAIGLQFTGRFASRILGRLNVSKTGQLVTEFASVPDVPLTSLDLGFAPGNGSALIATAALCKAPVVFSASFEGHHGGSSATTAAFDCSGGAKVASALLSGRMASALRLKLTAPAGQRIRSATIRLPSGMTVRRTGLAKGGLLRGLTGTSAVKRTGSRTLRVTPKGKAPASITVSIPRAKLSLTAAAKQRTRLKVAATITTTAGKRHAVSTTVKP